MSNLFIHLDCVPPTATAQQKGERIVKLKSGRSFISHYKKKPVMEAQKLFCGLLTPFIPPSPITGPVIVEAQWVFPWRASERKGTIREFQRIPKDTKPDVDNSNKLLLDCLTQLGIWEDDSQAYRLVLDKYWGDKPGIYLKLTYGESLPAMPRKEVML